jgi:ferredoxin--NADP+ reductase
MVVDAPYVAEHRKAGQFIILLIDEFGERLPLTIADRDPGKGTIPLIYQIVGTTTANLAKLKAGESLYGIAGPLGHPTEIKKYGNCCACVACGIVLAPSTRSLKL